MSLKKFIKELNLVDAKDVKLSVDTERNALTLFLKGKVYYNVVPRKPFPFSRPYFIIFTTKDGNEICMIKDYRKLDKESRKCLEFFLEKMYFIPVIKKIKSIKYQAGEYVWEVETDKGHRVFNTRGRRCIFVRGNEIFVLDTNDNVYKIVLSHLDIKSRSQLELVL